MGGFILFFILIFIIFIILKLAKVDKGGVAAKKNARFYRGRKGDIDSHGGFGGFDGDGE